MNIVNRNEALLKGETGWQYFSKPHDIIAVTDLKDVSGALNEIERQVEEHGWHAAGFLSYEAASAFDPVLRTHGGAGFPYLWFGLYSPPQPVSFPNPETENVPLRWQPNVDRTAHNAAIDRIRDSIAQGKTYQVNYTLRLQADFDASEWEVFLHLARSQNRYAAYIDTGRYVICSASPELFFELNGETIISRPMKGTIQRGRTTQEDRAQAARLQASEKNRAENVMIVDMIRNDLGRIARPGSVHVPELFHVERYPSLWQMTSTVAARTAASLAGIFGALFPCASITGAPKVSTMNIIHELETSPRRIYTGTIGCFAPGRTARFNVAIRTMLIDRQEKKAEYGTGGGIVWDSTSTEEYDEALLKARVLTDSPPHFSLLETMLWTPETGFFLLDRHLGRLLDSADYFDFNASKDSILEKLDQAASSWSGPRRVRLVVSQEGDIEISSVPFTPQEKPLLVSLADKPVDSNNVFLFHKTTSREVYENARAGSLPCDDVLLYNERGELTEFTIGNLVVELDGHWITPPIECGLLAGTFRAHLIETGQIIERIVPIHRLMQCTKIYRVNSVRKWEVVDIQEYNSIE
ncbi:MAG: aminodeoxychorismate synthase component I [Bacteroidota bacterium]